MTFDSNQETGEIEVVAVHTESGTVKPNPTEPNSIESYSEMEFTLKDNRRITLEVDDIIIDSSGQVIGRIHSLRHLGGMDGWGYAVYLEYPPEDSSEFGQSEGVRLPEVAEWFEKKNRTTGC